MERRPRHPLLLLLSWPFSWKEKTVFVSTFNTTTTAIHKRDNPGMRRTLLVVNVPEEEDEEEIEGDHYRRHGFLCVSFQIIIPGNLQDLLLSGRRC